MPGSQVINISGQRFGKLVVVCRDGRDSTGKTTWLCQCDCGEKTIATGLNIKNGTTRSCGCMKRRSSSKRKNVSGKRFGRLIAREIASIERGVISWKCVCDCGRTTVVKYGKLQSGYTKSCGCLVMECLAAGRKARKGKTASRTTRSPRFRSWSDAAWSKKIISRDKSCVVCFSTEKLEAHHLHGYTKHECVRRDMGNGVCLCRKCHKQFHKSKGVKRFTREDFFDFFGFPDPGDWSPLPSAKWVYDGPLGPILRLIGCATQLDNEERNVVLKMVIHLIDAEIDRCEESK